MKTKLCLALLLTSTAFATDLGQAQLAPLEQLSNHLELEASITDFTALQFPVAFSPEAHGWYNGYAAGLRQAASEARQLQMVQQTSVKPQQPLSTPQGDDSL